MRKTTWPFANLHLEDLPEEVWRDIPGYDGDYQVSTYGRIKSLRRWRACGCNGAGYYTGERIRKQNVRRAKNHLIGKDIFCLGITLKKNGVNATTSTARCVYYAFVAPFDLANKDLVVSYKDWNGLNLHYSNLFLTGRSNTSKRSIRDQRSRPPFVDYKLPVRQLTMDGKLVAAYDSLKEAQDKTGFNFSAISSCIKGRIFQCYGYKWESPVSKKPSPPAKQETKDYFNEYLWRKLDKPRTSRKNPIPALNLSPHDLEGEKWKPIEGLNGAYLVSNLGRIKANPRFKHGRLHVWTKGTIKRLIPDAKDNRPTSCLTAQLTKGGRKYEQSVARLVYHHFVKKISLRDKSPRIKYRNCKCYDLHWKNLVLP
jgi:NUMOD4 motif